MFVSEKQRKDINIYFFSIYDKKNKGFIKTDNQENIFLYDALLNSLYYLGIKMKEFEIYDLINQKDFNKNGIINFEQFIHIIDYKLQNFFDEKQIKDYFYILSENKNYILTEDFYKLFEILDKNENINDLLQDIDNEGKIYFEDFYRIFI